MRIADLKNKETPRRHDTKTPREMRDLSWRRGVVASSRRLFNPRSAIRNPQSSGPFA
jgi:hypothetical protein